MHTQANKKQVNKNQGVLNKMTQKQNKGESALQLMDNRSDTIANKRLQRHIYKGAIVQRNKEGWSVNKDFTENILEKLIIQIKLGQFEDIKNTIKFLKGLEGDPKGKNESTFWQDMRTGDFKKDFIGPLHWLAMITSGDSYKEESLGLTPEKLENYIQITDYLKKEILSEDDSEVHDYKNDKYLKNKQEQGNVLPEKYKESVDQKGFLNNFIEYTLGAEKKAVNKPTIRKVTNSRKNAENHLSRIVDE